MIGRPLLVLFVALASAACFAGERSAPGTETRNGGTTSLFFAREQAGGDREGPLGFTAPLSRSGLYAELESKGIRAEALGPLNQIRDRNALLSVMSTFSRALGVRCSFCHETNDWAAPTPRKAVAAFMWDFFIGQLELADGSPLYCDSCHHQSSVFLRRDVGSKLALSQYMQMEYVDELRRRDGQTHGCATCHGTPFNPRFLPRLSEHP